MKKYPCTPDCPRRKPGCHGTCKEYLDVKAENDMIIEARRRQNEENDYHIKAALKIRYKTIKEKMGK